jgi:parallel beta-helix repeat protein
MLNLGLEKGVESHRKTVSIILLSLLAISALALAYKVQPAKASGTVGVEAGDWIKYTYTISGWPSGTPYPEWLKVEFLSVEGTNATIRVTMRMSDGTEQSDTMTVDVAAGGGTFQGLSGFVIPANCTTGDSIYMTGYGNVTIAGETTRTYAGATRTVVYASFSQYGTQLTYYWDKQTGVMVEASVTSGDMTGTAKATETNMWQAEIIYIRVDGSIEPSTAAITTVDNITYTFTGNIYDEIVVERDNIVVDGAGYTVQGTGASGSKGIGLSGRSNVTIKNMIIRYFWEGIILEYSSNNTISENKVANNSFGIYLSESKNNSLSGNNITANNYGVIIEFSFNNVLRNNNMFNNKYNFGGVYGYGLSQFVNDVDVSNTVDGKPIYYWVNEADRAVPMDAGCVVLVNSTRITVRNLNLTKNRQGIRLAFTTNSTIAENSIANNDDGIRLEYSSNNSISGNNITNHIDGIYLVESSNDNTISGNNITANIRYGIMLYGYSNNNSISGNNVANSFDGIYLGGPGGSNNSVSENNITANIRCGIRLYYSPDNNSISGNHIANNQYGIGLEGSSGNKFYHNNFINNINQVYSSDSVNVWDDGYPSGGNYWSDYASFDVKSGPGQDLPGSDGIGDTLYIIDADNVDHYPLMNPYGAPPTYALAITTTVGGTTDPAPGTYSYTANSTVQVIATPEAGYFFDYWELNDVNVGSANPYSVLMDKNHALKAVFSLIPPPLSASISPLSASILVGQSVTFTSTVSGGYAPYSYQWYLNAAPVSGATSNTWALTPATSGIYHVYLKVTDAKGNTAQSETARITVATVPVGGYSFPIQVQTKAEPIIPYIALIAILTAIFAKLRPKTRARHKN